MARARENLAAGGLIDLVEFREGDALTTLSVDLPKRSTWSCLTAPSRSILKSSTWWKAAFGLAHLSLPTTPTTVPSTWRAFALPKRAIFLCRSPMTSRFPCASANPEPFNKSRNDCT